jgi:DNA-binding beta-propeller fold protein YncE
MRNAKQVAVVDLKGMKVERTIDVPGGPAEILVSEDGSKAYVACNYADQVAVIDLKKWQVERLIDAGKDADGMALAR